MLSYYREKYFCLQTFLIIKYFTDFSGFFCKNLHPTPLKKVSPLLSSNPSAERMGGAHYENSIL